MKRYIVTGKLNAPVDILQAHSIGDEIEADLDRDEERRLVDAGAIRPLPAKQQPKHESKEEK